MWASSFRLWIAVGLVLAACLGTQWVRSGYRHEGRPPSLDIDDLPATLGEWTMVEEVPLDGRTADVLGADDFVHRTYEGPLGDKVSVQVAVWSDHSDGPTGLHYPEVCYRNAGWQIVETQQGAVQPTAEEERPLRLMLLEKSGEQVVTAHWFQMGDATFFSVGEARAIHRQFWGKRDWPCEVKVLIQTVGGDIETTRPRLEEFASAVASWTEQLH